MAKSKIVTGVVAVVNGWEYIMVNGDKVQSNMNHEKAKEGDSISYVLISSCRTVRIRTRTNQWDETRFDGPKFYKQC